MKKWTDEECRELLARCDTTPDAIRAAVEEARREEREACANLVSENRIVYHSHDPHYRLEPNNPRFGPDANQRAMAAAILARDKEPRK